MIPAKLQMKTGVLPAIVNRADQILVFLHLTVDVGLDFLQRLSGGFVGLVFLPGCDVLRTVVGRASGCGYPGREQKEASEQDCDADQSEFLEFEVVVLGNRF